jgi:hypothetical protein
MNSSLVAMMFASVVTAAGCLESGSLTPPQQGGTPSAGGVGGAAPVPPQPGGHGGTRTPDGAGGAPLANVPLVTNADGWLEPNPAGAVGQWWGTGDYYGEDGTPGAGPCSAAGFPMSACSTLTTPTPGMPFRPDPAYGEMCTSGTAAQVLPGSDGQLGAGARHHRIRVQHLRGPAARTPPRSD